MKSRPVSLRARGRRAFTLIELLTVIAIIAILAALLLQTSGYIQEKAGNSRAQSEIAALGAALENYKSDYGVYPTQASGGDNSTAVLIKSLAIQDPTNNPLGKIYFEVPRKMLEGRSSSAVKDLLSSPTAKLIDPFGNPYHYEYRGPDDTNSNRSGKGQFNLWSQGKKNSTNENLWIKNW